MTKSTILEEKFSLYLLSEKDRPSCERIGKVLGMSGDTVLRYLASRQLTGTDLYQKVEGYIESKQGGILCVDDSVQDRLRSFESKSDLIGQHYSGNHKSIVNGVDIVTLFWVYGEQKLPLTFRILDPLGGKTKHDLLREMMDDVLGRGFKPSLVTADSFYSTNDNIAKLIQKGIGVFMGIKSNRLARNIEDYGKKADYIAIASYIIPSEGRIIHVKGLGTVKVFRFDDRNYVYHSGKDKSHTDYEETAKLTREEAKTIQRSHRCIEEYHRVMKQLCNLEGMIMRQATQIANHIFYAIKAYCILEITRTKHQLKSWYSTITNDTINNTKDLLSKMSLDGLCLV